MQIRTSLGGPQGRSGGSAGIQVRGEDKTATSVIIAALFDWVKSRHDAAQNLLHPPGLLGGNWAEVFGVDVQSRWRDETFFFLSPAEAECLRVDFTGSPWQPALQIRGWCSWFSKNPWKHFHTATRISPSRRQSWKSRPGDILPTETSASRTDDSY